MWLIALGLAIVIVLIVWEYKQHDCIPGKDCHQFVAPPDRSDPIPDQVTRIYEMVNHGYEFSIWRQALLVGIIFAFFTTYFLRGRPPTLLEWFFVTLLIALGFYLMTSWLCFHFFTPNFRKIERSLLQLRDRLSGRTARRRRRSSNRNVGPSTTTQSGCRTCRSFF